MLLDFKNFNKTELAAKLLIISRSYSLISGELLEDKEKFDMWTKGQCNKNFVMNNDLERDGCRIYLQGFLLGVSGNKFQVILDS